ncbi:hypothetical protein DACRYDRAFT_76556 [Dacryopinax primogenitus]|uniref:Uncharacterized protein n=1 Tax=Dacryopinax primogenitus (strain DJM 731) TaxID=1858805 RepID=M5GFL0_DACPD|nr:uncharacterized protein DACRYDRAFT_76556 [Dacryopinax primogenitus]EJU04198.1 hypothetical protein DACRYDRAFT_76556 [Dacryopinax primogenitus]
MFTALSKRLSVNGKSPKKASDVDPTNPYSSTPAVVASPRSVPIVKVTAPKLDEPAHEKRERGETAASAAPNEAPKSESGNAHNPVNGIESNGGHSHESSTPSRPEPSTRSSSGNVLAKIWSVDWAIQKQTVTTGPPSARVDRQAYLSAVRLRSVIVGSSALATDPSAKLSSADAKKLRESLQKPDEAQPIVAQLRRLASHPDHEKLSASAGKPAFPAAPIHAACLSVPDEEAAAMHFSKLIAVNALKVPPPPTAELAARLPVLSPTALESAFGSMNLVSLVTAPDLGLGHPASDPGIFSGAVPSTQEIETGIEEVSRTLLALGFAGSGMVWPDHTGVYPPTDRMSCYTYWWGYELVLPHKSVQYLSKCKSISGAMLDFLTALALFTEGVREILPFIRYISQFVDMEFDGIAQQDRGQGVVCAATWLIPVSLVPRTWDFPPRPANLPVTYAAPKPILTSTRTSGTTSAPLSAPGTPAPIPMHSYSAPVTPEPVASDIDPLSFLGVRAFPPTGTAEH